MKTDFNFDALLDEELAIRKRRGIEKAKASRKATFKAKQLKQWQPREPVREWPNAKYLGRGNGKGVWRGVIKRFRPGEWHLSGDVILVRSETRMLRYFVVRKWAIKAKTGIPRAYSIGGAAMLNAWRLTEKGERVRERVIAGRDSFEPKASQSYPTVP